MVPSATPVKNAYGQQSATLRTFSAPRYAAYRKRYPKVRQVMSELFGTNVPPTYHAAFSQVTMQAE